MENENPIRGQLLKPQEAADILRIDVKTVYAMAKKGELHPFRVSQSLRFDSADIEDYLFLSKFRNDKYIFKPEDIEDLFNRIYSQVEHAKKYIQTLTGRKRGRKEPV
jgi:excisionase family DNA binding protein